MTYKTRQEVLRAAADWMDVCEKVGVEAKCKVCGIVRFVSNVGFCSLTHELDAYPNDYEFPLALLEGKEVWVGSELYDSAGIKYVAGYAKEQEQIWAKPGIPMLYGTSKSGHTYFCQIENAKSFSWNPPKPSTVMVEMLTSDAENIVWFADGMHITLGGSEIRVIADACKKALEKL